MSGRVPSGEFVVAHDCGFVKTSRTQGLADKAFRQHSCETHRGRQDRARRVDARKALEGEKRDCRCKVARHVHGTRTAYVVDRCRCRPCTDASRTVQAERTRLQAYGRYDSGRVDAQPVRVHLRMLMHYGIGLKRIAAIAGVSNATLGKILYGDRTRNIVPRERTEKHVANAVLAVKPSLENLGRTVSIDGAGTRRRLQALVSIGWSQSRLGKLIGMTPGNFGRTITADRVHADTARKVRSIYEQLWDQPQTGEDWHSRAAATRARRTAAERGWPPPMAWDDETIDDPTVQPAAGENQHGSARLVEDVEFLCNSGAGQEELAARLGKSWATIERALHRYQRSDLIAMAKQETGGARQARRGRAA